MALVRVSSELYPIAVRTGDGGIRNDRSRLGGTSMPRIVTIEIARLVRLIRRTGKVIAWRLQVIRFRRVLPDAPRRRSDREGDRQ